VSDLHLKTLTEIRDLLAGREVSVTEATAACLDQVRATEPKIKAMITVTGEDALRQAEEMDRQGPDPGKPLWGVPVTVKDVICTKGIRTTCASRILENFVPFYDAFVTQKLKQAGAVIVGKTNMDEFAMGSSTENSAFFPTRNPWDTRKVPGGSSGGAAAGTAACQAYGALGTDTGGSIRLPAGFCGVAGMKPTYGRVSRFGVVAYGSSLDQVGPLARTVPDLAEMLKVIAGHDPRDSTSVKADVPDYPALVDELPDLTGIRLGAPEQYWENGLDPDVKKTCEQALATARSLGAEIVPVSLPLTEYAVSTYYIVVMAEASSNLARYDGVKYGYRDKDAAELIEMYAATRSAGFGDEVQRRIMIGTHALSSGYYDAYYKKAAQVRRLMLDNFTAALDKCDAIVGPVCPMTAFDIGEKTEDPLQLYLMDIFTATLNLCGLPGLSLPVGLGETSGLPVGLQILGRAFDEAKLLQIARVLEKNTEPLPYPRGL